MYIQQTSYFLAIILLVFAFCWF